MDAASDDVTGRTVKVPGQLPGHLSLLLVTAIAPLTWGTTYAVTTELLPADRPLLAGALRALPAGLILFAITRRVPRGSWWWRAAVLGVLNIGGFFALLFVAAERLHGGVAATLGAIQPLVAALLAARLLGERLRRRTLVAGALGAAGVAMIVLQPGARLDGWGVAAGLTGALSMATGVTLAKRWAPPVPVLASTAWQLLAGGGLLACLGLVVEGPPPALTAANLAGFAWLSVVGTALAYGLWFRGIARLPVANVSLLGLLSPVIAVSVGWLVLDQQLGAVEVAGAAVVLVALRLGQRQPARGASRQTTRRTVGNDTSGAPAPRSSVSTGRGGGVSGVRVVGTPGSSSSHPVSASPAAALSATMPSAAINAVANGPRRGEGAR